MNKYDKMIEENQKKSKGKIELIHNYVDINKIINKSNLENISFDSDKLNILSIGRIVSEKGFDRIINIAKKYENKINSGSPVAIAEVIRDLHRNENLAEQSYSERQIYEQALDRLSNEYAVCENISAADATKRILDILSK